MFMRDAMRYLSWLQGLGVPVVVTLHDTRDCEAARQLVPPGLEIFLPANMDELQARFQDCRGVIGFRLHAALLGLGLGRPAIPVGVDWRGLGFIETFGLQPISIRSRRPGQFRKLRVLTRLMLDGDRALFEMLNEAKASGRRRQGEFLADAFRRLLQPERTEPRPS
jgi:polysaccharide pyruvyl transferase WcaK-like protein